MAISPWVTVSAVTMRALMIRVFLAMMYLIRFNERLRF
jgi:hypothetical protein